MNIPMIARRVHRSWLRNAFAVAALLLAREHAGCVRSLGSRLLKER